MGTIKVNYPEVHNKTNQLHNYIECELTEMDATYRQAQPIPQNMDGGTNAELMDTMVATQRKARLAADTHRKLLLFVKHSAFEVDRNDELHKRVFQLSNIAVRRMGGTNNA